MLRGFLGHTMDNSDIYWCTYQSRDKQGVSIQRSFVHGKGVVLWLSSIGKHWRRRSIARPSKLREYDFCLRVNRLTAGVLPDGREIEQNEANVVNKGSQVRLISKVWWNELVKASHYSLVPSEGNKDIWAIPTMKECAWDSPSGFYSEESYWKKGSR